MRLFNSFNIYKSEIKGSKGFCVCVWRNHSQIDIMLDGVQSGFFRLLRNPFKEFHGAFYKSETSGEIRIF